MKVFAVNTAMTPDATNTVKRSVSEAISVVAEFDNTDLPAYRWSDKLGRRVLIRYHKMDITKRRQLMTNLLLKCAARDNHVLFAVYNTDKWYMDTQSMFQSILNIVRKEGLPFGVFYRPKTMLLKNGSKRVDIGGYNDRQVILYRTDTDTPVHHYWLPRNINTGFTPKPSWSSKSGKQLGAITK